MYYILYVSCRSGLCLFDLFFIAFIVRLNFSVLLSLVYISSSSLLCAETGVKVNIKLISCLTYVYTYLHTYQQYRYIYIYVYINGYVNCLPRFWCFSFCIFMCISILLPRLLFDFCSRRMYLASRSYLNYFCLK